MVLFYKLNVKKSNQLFGNIMTFEKNN